MNASRSRIATRGSQARRRVSFAVMAAGIAAWSGPLHAAQSALKGPYVTAVSDSEVTLRFELETAASASVDITALGPAPRAASADASAASAAAPLAAPAAARPVQTAHFESHETSVMHVVHVTGLQPATRYAYVVRAVGASVGDRAAGASVGDRAAGVTVGDGHIVTAPRPGEGSSGSPFTFLVYGDNRTDDAAHASVVRAMTAVPSDLLVNTGDMVADGASAANWQSFFDIEKPLLRERALLPAIGNHELYDDASGSNFARYFGYPDETGKILPYGTARFGSARFFFLNGMDDWSSGQERQWLERALAKADGEPGLVWRFAVVHHGPWSAGPHGPNASLNEAGIPQLLAAHKVDLLLAGHDHIYERGDAGILKYIISGGGGAPLYRELHDTTTTRRVEPAHHFVEVTAIGETLRIVAHRDDGSLLDQCGFAKGAPWDCDAPRTGQTSGAPAAASGSASGAPSAPSGASGAAAAPSGPSQTSTGSSGSCAFTEPGRGGSPARAFGVLAGLALVTFARSRRRSRSRAR